MLKFDESKKHPRAKNFMDGFHSEIIAQVRNAVDAHDVVMVGMAQNPFPKKARKLLDSQGIKFHYLEYGSYASMWKERLALKIWVGWPTFPMIFIKGTFIGGSSELQKLVDEGELAKMLA